MIVALLSVFFAILAIVEAVSHSGLVYQALACSLLFAILAELVAIRAKL